MAKHKRAITVRFDHDTEPDFSWLRQAQYDPRSREYSPVYHTTADMRAKRKPIDGDFYRNPDNHVALCMLVYEECDFGELHLIDSLGNIDFLKDSDEWRTGDFSSLRQIPRQCRYLRELAREAGLR